MGRQEQIAIRGATLPLLRMACPPPNNQLLHSIYPNGTQVAFVPTPGGGFDTTLIVGNDTSFAPLPDH